MATPRKRPDAEPAAARSPRMPVGATADPTNHEIAQRAYHIFFGGGEPGHDLDDWLEAESSCSAKRRAPPVQQLM